MTDRRAALYAVVLTLVGGIVGAAIAWTMLPPEIQAIEVEVPYHWTTTATATATMTVTAPAPTVTVTRTPPVSRDKTRQATGDTVWDRLAQCESGGRWDYNGSSGYDGGLQFSPKYWPYMAKIAGVTDAYAWQATREEQIRVAKVILSRQGWGAWPACSTKLGLR